MKPDRPLVTIVTPVLNGVKQIELCLMSVRGQTYPSIEHIVVDGGSEDGTVELLRNLADQGDVKLLIGRDSGMYEAINKGLAMARGRVIGYLNSDDFLLPWAVEASMDCLALGCDVSFGDLVIIKADRGYGSTYLQFSRTRFDPQWHAYVQTLSQPTVYWRKEAMEQVGWFDTNYRLIGDCEYWLRLAAAGLRFGYSQEVIAVQLDHASTLRAQHPELLADEFARLREQYRPLAGSSPSRLRIRICRPLFARSAALVMAARLRGLPGGRWRHFVDAVRRGYIPIRGVHLAFYFLPAALRPSSLAPYDLTPLIRDMARGSVR